MVRGGRSRDIGEVVITGSELPRVGEVGGDVVLGELLTHRGVVARPAKMVRISRLRDRMSVQGNISDYYPPCPALTYDCGHKLPLGQI